MQMSTKIWIAALLFSCPSLLFAQNDRVRTAGQAPTHGLGKLESLLL